MDEFTPRQLCALLLTALSAPLAMVCAAVSWPWVLTAVAVAGLLYLYLLRTGERLPAGLGYADMLCRCWGKLPGAALLALYWGWAALSAAGAARMAELAFPQDRAFPLIPLVLLFLAALTASRSSAAVARFGGVLFLAVAALLAFTLAFGAADVELRNLRPAGSAADLTAPLAVLTLPAAALFLRDRLAEKPGGYARWYLLAAALACAISAVCVGALGLPLARASSSPFWLMSRSISVLGVMERFEALISALLSLGFCCLLTLLLCAGRKAAQGAVPPMKRPAAVWVSAAAAAASLWAVPLLPAAFWTIGSLIFWVILPILTLGIVPKKNFRNYQKKA